MREDAPFNNRTVRSDNAASASKENPSNRRNAVREEAIDWWHPVGVAVSYGYIAKVRAYFHVIWCFVHLSILAISPARDVVLKDIEQWLVRLRHFGGLRQPRWKGLVILIWQYPEFRNLFYYRIERHPHLPSRLLLEIA